MSVMQHAAAEDDPRRVGRYGPFAIAIVTISIVIWPIAFNLGAYGVVFYEDIFLFVVVATAGLAVSLLSAHKTGGQRWYVNLALAAPLIWFVLAAIFTDSTADAATNPVLGSLALAIGIVSIPTVLWLMTDMFVPGFRAYESRRLLVGGVLVLVGMAGAGYFVGVNNDFFLTCADFKVAGSDQPENCDPG
jgi:predicted neutral ceramidase superfamily lipid hydrolase